jgi:hypothetical protein
MPDLARRLAVARGDEPADLVVRGGRVFSVFTREWLETDVAVVDGHVAGLGDYEGTEELDAAYRYVVPGFVDAHMHLETTKLLVDEFAQLVLPLGTTTVVVDPHEIANVLGTDGVHWLLDVCGDLPLDVYFMASSSVPASSFESPRRSFSPGDLEGLLRRRRVIGLAEMMNFPGVISGDQHELAMLALPGARHVDGHAPGVVGKALNAYAAAGIYSDHEAFTIEEGRERLRAGMWLLIREASAARNLQALIPLASEFGPGRIAFCTDDREPEHIADDGHINTMVRDAVAAGIPPRTRSRWRRSTGDLAQARPPRREAPGYRGRPAAVADLESFVPETVLKRGRGWARSSVEVPVGEAHRPHPARRRKQLRDPVGRREGARDRRDPRPDRDRGPCRGAHGGRRAGGCELDPGPRQDRRRRAAPRHRTARGGTRARVRAALGGARLNLLPRRAQHRRCRYGRPGHGPGARAADGDRRGGRRRGSRRPRGAGLPAAESSRRAAKVVEASRAASTQRQVGCTPPFSPQTMAFLALGDPEPAIPTRGSPTSTASLGAQGVRTRRFDVRVRPAGSARPSGCR